MGAVLTQHTAWVNAARAIETLRARGLLTPARVAALGASDLAGVIRPAGTPSIKARRLQALTGWLVESMGGTFRRLRTEPRDLQEAPGPPAPPADRTSGGL